jgi:hypothetical protein
MSNETDAHEGGAEGVEPTAVEAISEATTEQTTGAEQTGAADDAGEATEEPVKKVPWFQKRIDEVTAQKYEAQRQADYWRGLAEGRAPQAEPHAQEQQVPDRWEDPEGYDRWLIREAATAAREEIKTEQRFRSYSEREEAFRATKPDYDTIVRDPSLPITPLMAEVIRESEKGPELAYYLASNRSELAQIASRPPHLQAAALGRIEASLTTPAPAPAAIKPIPHAPPQTVSGLSAGLTKPLDEMSMSEYVAARERKQT